MRDTQLVEDLRRLAPFDPRWLAIAACVTLLLALVGWYRLRRRPPATPPGSATGPSPWEVALSDLEALAGRLHPEASRDYAIAATGILRRYVEQRFGIAAPRQATEEFLRNALHSPLLGPQPATRLGHFLEAGDLFKFGRFTATTPELLRLHEAALAFVVETRPAPAAPPTPNPGGGAA